MVAVQPKVALLGAALLLVIFYEVARARTLRAASPARSCERRGLLPLDNRDDIGFVLQREGASVGAEVGVQTGQYSARVLETWPGAAKYYLVDLWAHQEAYNDGANYDNATHEVIYDEARTNLKQWDAITTYLRKLSVVAADDIPDESLDFVYIDARHDYCGAAQDLKAYYRKVKPGGIIAGHDYLDNAQVKEQNPEEDWSLCEDGTRNEGAVKGAVNDWATKEGLILIQTREIWCSWLTRKPCDA